MSDWWSYAAGDFLLFSPRAYWRLFELHNQALWPAQIAAIGLGLGLVFLLLRPRPGGTRAAALVLAALWVFVAWSFLLQRYAAINWTAPYAAVLFLAEALLLAWAGGRRGGLPLACAPGLAGRIGLGLFAYALLLHPLVAPLAGRPLQGAELFGIAPDPTAIATLGLLAAMPGGRLSWLLMLAPLAWCLFSAATLLAMAAWQGFIPLAAVALALGARLYGQGRSTNATP